MRRKSKIVQIYGSLPADEELFAMVERAIRDEKGYLDKDIDMEIMSERIGIHRNHLSRVVNRFAGVNFPTYVTSLRLAEAKRLARTGKYKVAELAAAAGFSSRTAFYRAAQKANITPSLLCKTERINNQSNR